METNTHTNSMISSMHVEGLSLIGKGSSKAKVKPLVKKTITVPQQSQKIIRDTKLANLRLKAFEKRSRKQKILGDKYKTWGREKGYSQWIKISNGW